MFPANYPLQSRRHRAQRRARARRGSTGSSVHARLPTRWLPEALTVRRRLRSERLRSKRGVRRQAQAVRERSLRVRLRPSAPARHDVSQPSPYRPRSLAPPASVRARPDTVAPPAEWSSLAPPERQPEFSRTASISFSGISLDREPKVSLTLSAVTAAALACPGRIRVNSSEATPFLLAWKRLPATLAFAGRSCAAKRDASGTAVKWGGEWSCGAG